MRAATSYERMGLPQPLCAADGRIGRVPLSAGRKGLIQRRSGLLPNAEPKRNQSGVSGARAGPVRIQIWHDACNGEVGNRRRNKRGNAPVSMQPDLEG